MATQPSEKALAAFFNEASKDEEHFPSTIDRNILHVRTVLDWCSVDPRLLASTLDVSEAFVLELERYGLITGSAVGNDTFFDGDALQVTRVAAAFASFGIDARHLRMYKMSVEREMSVFEQVLVPLMRDRDPQRAQQVEATLHELIQLGEELRDVLLARSSRPFR